MHFLHAIVYEIYAYLKSRNERKLVVFRVSDLSASFFNMFYKQSFSGNQTSSILLQLKISALPYFSSQTFPIFG